MRKLLTYLVVAAGIVMAGPLALAAVAAENRAVSTAPQATAQEFSVYIEAKDGTKLAASISLPKNLSSGEVAPALIKGTPYWRAYELTPLGVEKTPDAGHEPDVSILNARGYAVISVDARGTGASFGAIKTLFSDAEVSDYSAVADWIIKQPWSNGKVGAYGFSYRGMTAANIASLPNSEIKAVAPLFDLTDLYLLTHPGGAFAEYLMREWGAQTHELNSGIVPCGGPGCSDTVRGPKPVDTDSDHKLLNEAIAEHAGNFDPNACMRAAPARDDLVCASGQSVSDVSVLARKAKIEQRGLPMFVLTGWLDESSPEQALFRFNSFSNPQELVIGPFTHGGFKGDDQFQPDRPLDLTFRKQTEMMADFFDRYLKDVAAKPMANSVQYYVNGAGTWETSPAWPPRGTAMKKWYLGSSKTLTTSAVDRNAVADRYAVDFDATTGALSGYRGQVDLSKTDYGNRADADSHLLTYTSAPVEGDVTIAGNPVAHIRLASSATDGLAIIYLEDVAPDGRVTYITQGVLRLAFRKLASGDDSAISADPLHTYLRADMTPTKPGVFEDVAITISPIAALIRKGHRLRVAIAGADAENLERLPATGDASLTVARGLASYVEIPQER